MNANKVKVSVVIPVYNTEKYLRECLDSVCNQSLKEIEIICVDDGSTDNSLNILEEYKAKDNRITILKQKNLHAGAARNAGAAIASGETIAFLDADDWVEKDCYEKLYTNLIDNNAQVSACFHIWFNENDGIISYNGKLPWDKQTSGIVNLRNNAKYLMYRRFVAWDKLYRMDFFKNYHLKFSELLCSNDRSFYIQTIKYAERIYLFNDYLIHYRTNNNNSLSFNSTLDNFKCRIKAFEECWDLLQDSTPRIKRMMLDITLKDFLYPYSRAEGRLKEEIYELLKTYIKTMDLFLFGKEINTYKWYPAIKEIIGELSSDELKALNLLKEHYYNYNGLNLEEPRDNHIIISFTSFPSRINTVFWIFDDMLNQTVRPDKIILWLAKDQFDNIDLPIWGYYYTKLGVEIRYCNEDLRGHKKYFYAMQEFPDDIIITIDDDVHYASNFIEMLLKMHKIYPNAVVCRRAHQMVFDIDGNIQSYHKWNKQYNDMIGYPRMDLCATGVSGCLYPPKCLDKRYAQKDFILKYCLSTDDLWLKAMEILNATPTVLADYEDVLEYIDGTQEVSLYNENAKNNANGNDIALQNILEKYQSELTEKIVSWDYLGKNDNRLISYLSKLIVEKETAQCYAKKRVRINRRNQKKEYNEIINNLNKNIKKLKKENRKLKKNNFELKLIADSTTYKVGRIIMFIPCRIKDFFIKKGQKM